MYMNNKSSIAVVEEKQSPISKMSLIHYSFTPLILFRVPYTIDFLPYCLSIANGTGGIGIFELLVFQGFSRSYRVTSKAIEVLYILIYYYAGILFVVLCEGWVSYTNFICRKPAVMCTNDQ